jgi:hypothetical protein
VPLNLTYGSKTAEDTIPFKLYAPQPWTKREVTISTKKRLNDVVSVEIDPSLRMADLDRKNNRLEIKW